MKKLISAALLGMIFMVSAVVPVVAETNTTPTSPAVKTVDVACVQTAIDKRDNAIIAAVDVYQIAVKTALSTRRDALKTAWAITVVKDRNAAIKAAWTVYRKSVSDTRKAFRNAKNAAWKQFSTDRKACKAPSNSSDASGQGIDQTL